LFSKFKSLSYVFFVGQDETGVYKNLLQEVSQRVGAPLPSYTTERSGVGHLPVFTCTVELAGIIFTGDPAKNKKQAEKNAASAAWSSLKQCEYGIDVVSCYQPSVALLTKENVVAYSFFPVIFNTLSQKRNKESIAFSEVVSSCLTRCFAVIRDPQHIILQLH
jgi:hypothetical protein